MATVALGFNISATATGMARGVNAAAVELEKLGYSAKKAANDLGVIKTIEIGRTIVSGLQSLVSTITSYVSQIDTATEATANLARELGISFGQLQELQIAAELSGVSAETLARAFTKAQITIAKAAAGSKEATAALASIGLDPNALAGMGSTEQFVAIAQAIAAIENPAQRAAAAVAIFGKSGAELLPVFRELQQNLEASRGLLAQFGGGVTQIEADKVTKIGDAFDLARRALGIFVTKVLAELAPVLIQASQNFVAFLASLDRTQIAATVAAVLKTLGGVLSTIYSIAKLLAPIFSLLAKFIQFIGNNATGAAAGLAAAAGALIAYQVGCLIATVATQGLGAAIRLTLSSTGIGALVVLLGLAVGALAEYALATDKVTGSSADMATETKKAAEEVKKEVEAMAKELAAGMEGTFGSAEEAAKNAAAAARREADAAVERMKVERDFGGDSAMASAAKAVEAIQADIKRTEEEIAAAREAGNQEAIDAGARRLADLDQALVREREIASGQRQAAEALARAAEERQRKEEEFLKTRASFDEKRLAELNRPKTGFLDVQTTNSRQGFMEAMTRFNGANELDPTIMEYRKQLKELVAIRRAIEQTVPDPVVQI